MSLEVRTFASVKQNQKDMEYKTISVNISDPANSLFKDFRNNVAECRIVSCKNSDNCPLYKRGQCVMSGIFIDKCPYGLSRVEYGFTRKAKKYNEWISEKRKQFEEVPYLKSPSKVMCEIGDYIYLPYPHMNMNEKAPFLHHSYVFSSGSPFMKKENFTIDVILSIIYFRPMSMMGGEIDSYQKEVIPKFIEHLSEIFPELYEKLAQKDVRSQIVVKNKTYIGRKAVLQSLNPNVGTFIDIHKRTWTWDGEWLHSKDIVSAFGLSSKNSETKVKPFGNVDVKITDDKQVNSNTIFLD